MPDEVLRYLLGQFGAPPGPVDPDVRDRAEISVDPANKTLMIVGSVAAAVDDPANIFHGYRVLVSNEIHNRVFNIIEFPELRHGSDHRFLFSLFNFSHGNVLARSSNTGRDAVH